MSVDSAESIEPIRVLLVDDDVDFNEMLGELLEKTGLKVTLAANVPGALEVCLKSIQDVVVSDLNMPGGSGVALLQKLKARTPALPIIIFLTGMPDVSLRSTYLQGADAVLKKPVSPQELSDVVKYLHAKRQGQVKSIADLNDLRERLVAVDRLVSLGIMASEIAHEIKGSLTIIQGNNLLMKSVKVPDEKEQNRVEQCSRRIEEAIFRISKIIQEVQNLSSADNSNSQIERQVQVSALTLDVLALCGDYLRSKSVKCNVEDIEPSLCIKGNVVQLSQLLINLIQNASDAVEKLPEKWIQLAWRAVDTDVVFTITDSGPGIPPELRAEIFRAFFTTKAVGKGTGLGLSIATKIVHSHGGTMAIDEACPNTRFVITFPRVSVG